MAGQRMQMEEVALSTMDDGRIVREEFFPTCKARAAIYRGDRNEPGFL